jgi:hypothetical protein
MDAGRSLNGGTSCALFVPLFVPQFAEVRFASSATGNLCRYEAEERPENANNAAGRQRSQGVFEGKWTKNLGHNMATITVPRCAF